jgi:hypothetical protein
MLVVRSATSTLHFFFVISEAQVGAVERGIALLPMTRSRTLIRSSIAWAG